MEFSMWLKLNTFFKYTIKKGWTEAHVYMFHWIVSKKGLFSASADDFSNAKPHAKWSHSKQLNVLNCTGLFPQPADSCISMETLQFVSAHYLLQHLTGKTFYFKKI